MQFILGLLTGDDQNALRNSPMQALGPKTSRPGKLTLPGLGNIAARFHKYLKCQVGGVLAEAEANGRLLRKIAEKMRFNSRLSRHNSRALGKPGCQALPINRSQYIVSRASLRERPALWAKSARLAALLASQ
jgi:hypothetical protein